MPLVLIMPRLRKYQQGDIIDEKDEEVMAGRYAWAVAEVSDADADKFKAIPHDPEQKPAERLVAISERAEVVAAQMSKLKPLTETKDNGAERKQKADAPAAAMEKPKATPRAAPATPTGKGENE